MVYFDDVVIGIVLTVSGFSSLMFIGRRFNSGQYRYIVFVSLLLLVFIGGAIYLIFSLINLYDCYNAKMC